MAARYAAKRLVAVEVRPNRSNQHEFNAGLLRKALGIEQERISGPLTLLFYTDDSGRAEVDESEFTLYDAREGQAHRGPEYRLYYTSRAVERYAREDDLLVVQRPARGNKLLGVVARSGTDVARELAAALEIGDGARLQRFVEAKPHAGSEKAAEVLGLRTSERRPMSDVETHPVYLEAVRTGAIPPPKVLAKAGRALAVERHGDRLSADDFLLLSMEAETDLFFATERAIKGEKLATLAARGAVAFDAIMEEAKRIQQSRRSRRGLSLQDHFAALLDREGIPYASQCKTERGETPDFVVPGRTEYHDARYPSDRLRMVACKSTSRERWRQVLTEAARVPQKFLLTLDEKLSRELVDAMRRSGLRVFMPNAIANDYADGFGLETVSSLVAELRAATEGVNR